MDFGHFWPDLYLMGASEHQQKSCCVTFAKPGLASTVFIFHSLGGICCRKGTRECNSRSKEWQVLIICPLVPFSTLVSLEVYPIQSLVFQEGSTICAFNLTCMKTCFISHNELQVQRLRVQLTVCGITSSHTKLNTCTLRIRFKWLIAPGSR